MTKRAQNKSRPNRVSTNLPFEVIAKIENAAECQGKPFQTVVRELILAGFWSLKIDGVSIQRLDGKVDS